MPVFVSIDTTHSGFKKLKNLKQEKRSWSRNDQLYPDLFYRDWIIARLGDWNEMAYIKNVIVTNKAINLDRAKDMVMTVIETLEKQENLNKFRKKEEPVNRKTEAFVMDSVAPNFYGATNY